MSRDARPHVVMIESPVALRRTRIVQELYGRLAATQPPSSPFWPGAIGVTARDRDPAAEFVRTWGQLAPDRSWRPPEGSTPPWLWWAISCESALADVPYGAMRRSLWQLARLARPLAVTVPGAEIDTGPVTGLLARLEPDTASPPRGSLPGLGAGRASPLDVGQLAAGIGAISRLHVPVLMVIHGTEWADEPLGELVQRLFDLDDAAVLVVASGPPEALAAGRAPAGDLFHRIILAMSRTAPERAQIVALPALPDSALPELVAGHDDPTTGTGPGAIERRTGNAAETSQAGPGSPQIVGELPAVRTRPRRR